MKRFEQLDHTADLALRIHGQDMRELYVNAAYAMFYHLAAVDEVRPSLRDQVCVEGADPESLLVNWLNELLYLHETQGRIYCAFDILALSPQRLQATAYGAESHAAHTIIKAATYHDLSIRHTDQGYVASIVFDV
jgi:SHS2 domain-containing protein